MKRFIFNYKDPYSTQYSLNKKLKLSKAWTFNNLFRGFCFDELYIIEQDSTNRVIEVIEVEKRNGEWFISDIIPIKDAIRRYKLMKL